MAGAVPLAALAVALAWPAPLALSRAAWPARHPVRALLLWQAIGLGGGLSLLAAELALAIARPGTPGRLAFAVTAAWLLTVLATSTVRVARARRRHRALLDVLADPGGAELPDDVAVLAHAGRAAYSVPGRHGRIVVSQGAREALAPGALRAAIAHERAHLRQHHDVVVQPFVAWRQSFRFLPAAAVAVAAVGELTEYLADDAARRRVGAAEVEGALLALLPAGDARDRRLARL